MTFLRWLPLNWHWAIIALLLAIVLSGLAGIARGFRGKE